MRWVRIAAVVVVVASLVTAHQLGAFEHVRDAACLQRAIAGLGPWGYLAFIGAIAVFQPIGAPGVMFVIAASLIWPWTISFPLSALGLMSSTSIGFAFSRFVARDWVSSMIPERFRKWEDALARRAFATIFVLRLFFLSQPLLHAFFGISKVKFSTHFWASLVAYAGPVFLICFFGPKLFDWIRDLPVIAWIAVGVVVVALVVLYVVRKRRVAQDGTASIALR